ncbi:MAG: hypothetical protein INR69_05170 [Mucilaginibacter polytrichastri]|nr:hypothetical protein [Mucilaginibacter polytrichastri]
MKTKTYAFILASFLSVSAANVFAADFDRHIPTKEEVAAMTNAEKTTRVEAIKQRAEDIKAMDRSQMSRAERKELRSELRTMEKQAQALGSGGVYLSVGAIIIIILVLIIIL